MKCPLKDLTVHYVTHGKGKPVILLHGSTLDYRSMVGCMEPIFTQRPGWQRFYLDLPGHGQTPAPNWITNQDHMLQVILDFIDAVIPNQPFLLVGLSYGGYLARGVLYQRMDQVTGLLLIVPRIVSEKPDRTLPPKTVLVRDDAFLATLPPEERAGFTEVAVIQTPEHWHRYDPLITPGVNLANHEFLNTLFTHGNEFSFNLNAQPAPFPHPVLILVGRQDHWVGYQDAWSIIEHYPRATFAVLDRSGHCLQLEQTQIFNTLVNEWLDRIEEQAISLKKI
ncbi:MAG: alpha/beta fold hydrolase [Candidatus Hodarchaeota archaeon]